jgi:hypothetical protein
MDVYLAVFDRGALDAGNSLFGAVEAYVDQHYVDAHTPLNRKILEAEREQLFGEHFAPCAAAPVGAQLSAGLDRAVESLDEPFSKALLRLIDTKGKTDAEVYKRANIDRRLFSKIRTNAYYMPGKRTVLALAVALELTPDEAKDLLERAGYALSHSQKMDVIVEYFLREGRYDVFEINETLFYYDQPLLGS